MVAHHALVGAAVGRQVLAGREDREERRLHAGDRGAQPRGLGAARAVGVASGSRSRRGSRSSSGRRSSSSPGRPRCPGSSAGAPGRSSTASSSARILRQFASSPAGPQERLVVEERLVADQRGAPEPALERWQRRSPRPTVRLTIRSRMLLIARILSQCGAGVAAAARRRTRDARALPLLRSRARSRSSLSPISRKISDTTAIAPSEISPDRDRLARDAAEQRSGDAADHDRQQRRAEREHAVARRHRRPSIDPRERRYDPPRCASRPGRAGPSTPSSSSCCSRPPGSTCPRTGGPREAPAVAVPASATGFPTSPACSCSWPR